MQAINLDTYNLSLLTAKEDILNSRSSTNWALFTYEGVTNNLKLSDSGAGGLTELAEKFHIAKPMYGLCRVGLTETGQPRIVMISWVGEDVDEYRRTECMSHVPAIKNFFKEAQVFISASGKDEVTEEKLGAVLAKVRPTKERLRRNSRPTEKEETVGTNYRKTNAAMEMRRINRDSFWARAERKEEERKKATEERRRLERERVLQERKEAEERDRKMEEKLQMIEEQKAEAKLEEEAKKQEKTKWELQQREHEEEMRACLRRSESIEKAAEAAALISQRSMNPREFFRQLSSSSLSSSSPVSPRTGKPPFRRYQRSLTDTAFIFERASTASGGPTSPLSPSLTSPFSRTPASPFNRPTSPPSPGFRPVTSPLCPRMPVRSPPVSPAQRSAPPLSSLPNLPISRPPPPRSSPPGLPSSQASSQASAPPTSPGPAEKEPSLNPDAPSTALPENPVQFKGTLASATSFSEETLVEEDEEVVELEESYAISPPPSETKTTLSSLDRGAPDQPPRPHSEAKAETAVGYLVEEIEEEDTNGTGKEKHDKPDQNGLYLQNGTDKGYVDCLEQSTPERCFYTLNCENVEDEDDSRETEVASENGESPEGMPLLCVRALFDYQAEDDSELSFEPGDVISHVEMVDKSWWRGYSKDGRQGLFPANYVETI
uniref:Drebrin n=1 Tax=Electrophorus electricus TaxID=8005 RepID=A0A4W4EAM6_ELEEL